MRWTRKHIGRTMDFSAKAPYGVLNGQIVAVGHNVAKVEYWLPDLSLTQHEPFTAYLHGTEDAARILEIY